MVERSIGFCCRRCWTVELQFERVVFVGAVEALGILGSEFMSVGVRGLGFIWGRGFRRVRGMEWNTWRFMGSYR